MKNPLRYQTTKYDCGPASLENAVNFLLEREKIPPAILKGISLFCMDQDNSRGELSKGGTSRMAMEHFCVWLNRYHAVHGFPVHCEFITGSDVCIEENSKIVRCLQSGGAAVVRVWLGCDHYVLLTGIDQQYVFLFDPYFREKAFRNKKIRMIHDQPKKMNRKVSIELINSEGTGAYEMGRKESRDAALFFYEEPMGSGR